MSGVVWMTLEDVVRLALVRTAHVLTRAYPPDGLSVEDLFALAGLAGLAAAAGMAGEGSP